MKEALPRILIFDAILLFPAAWMMNHSTASAFCLSCAATAAFLSVVMAVGGVLVFLLSYQYAFLRQYAFALLITSLVQAPVGFGLFYLLVKK